MIYGGFMISYERTNRYTHVMMNVLDKARVIQADNSNSSAMREMAQRVEKHCERKLDNITVGDILEYERESRRARSISR